MHWDDLRVFVASADAGTFSAAARRLGLSVATTTRRVAALEEALGARLFDRTPGGLALTVAGRALDARARKAATAMDDIERLAGTLQGKNWSGPVRVSATEVVVSEILAPALPALFAAAPDIRIDLAATTDVVSLAARDADVAVRLFKPEGDSLVVRRVAMLEFGLFASQALLRGRAPSSVDVRAERVIAFNLAYGPIAEQQWIERAGLQAAVAVWTSSTRAMLRAVAAGVGLAVLPRVLAARTPGLVEIEAPCPLPRRPAWLATHRELRDAPPVRAVRDWIAGAFRDAAEN